MWGWHLDAICEHLEAVERGDIKRLIINIPPGLGKSMLVSVYWPAWLWLRKPDLKMLCSSYGQALSDRDSQRCRDLIRSDWYRETFEPDWELLSDQDLKRHFKNSMMGERMATSTTGSVMGFRGDLVICDDPLKLEEAHSEAGRAKAANHVLKQLPSRVNRQQDARFVVVMQRLHEEDPAGLLLGLGGWDNLRLPARYEASSPCSTSIGWSDPRTTDGELLCSALLGDEDLSRLEATLGSREFAGQYQQRPAPDDGDIFQRSWFRRYTEPPESFDIIISSWDTAQKATASSDYTVGQVWGRHQGRFYLLDQVRARMTVPEIVDALKSMHALWRPVATLIEGQANGEAVIQTLKRSVPGVIDVRPLGGKVSRANAVAPLFEAGQVFVPPHLDAFIEECIVFPNGANDDQVDAMTQALARLSGMSSRRKPRFIR